MSQQKFVEAYNLIKHSENIILATHESPDGDALGSMLAFYNWMESAAPGKTLIWSADEIPEHLKFLPSVQKIKKTVPDEVFDLLVAFDYGDFQRLGLDEWIKGQTSLKIITFDHHPPGRQKGTVNLIDSMCSSTSELVHDFFEAIAADFGKDAAKCLLCGIIVDTGSFKHSNVTAKTLRAAKSLLLKGVTTQEIVKYVESGLRPLEAIRLWGEAILRMKVDPQTGLAVSFAGNEDLKRHAADKEWFSDFSSLMCAVPEARLSVFLTQDEKEPQFIKGSLRSEHGKGIDVSEVAKHFGGGGHRLASGFRVESTFEEAIEKLIKVAGTV